MLRLPRILSSESSRCDVSLREELQLVEAELEESRQKLACVDECSGRSPSCILELRESAECILARSLDAVFYQKVENTKSRASILQRGLERGEPKTHHLSEFLDFHEEDWQSKSPLLPSREEIGSVWNRLSEYVEMLPKPFDALEKRRIVAEAKLLLEELRLKKAKSAFRKAEETFGASVKSRETFFSV